MKNEIEEVNINLLLDRLYTTGKIDKRYMWALKDYITNLQERNEKLKELKNLYREKLISKFCANNRAIEYIKQYREVYYPDEPLSEPIIQYGLGIYEEDFDEEKLLNILQGENNTPENLYKYTPEKGFRLVGDDNAT